MLIMSNFFTMVIVTLNYGYIGYMLHQWWEGKFLKDGFSDGMIYGSQCLLRGCAES